MADQGNTPYKRDFVLDAFPYVAGALIGLAVTVPCLIAGYELDQRTEELARGTEDLRVSMDKLVDSFEDLGLK